MSSCLLVAALLAAQPTPNPKLDAFGDPLPEHAVMRLGTVRFRVPNLAGIAFRKSGELVALDADLTLHTWPLDDSVRPTKTSLVTKPSPGMARRLSPDARFLAIDTNEKVVIWDISGEKPVQYLEKEIKQAYRIEFSSNGEWLAIHDSQAPNQRGLRLCNLKEKTWAELPVTIQYPEAISFTPDGKWLAVTLNTGVVVIETATATQKVRVRTVDRPSCAAVSPDGTTLAVLAIRWTPAPESKVEFYSIRTGESLPMSLSPVGATRWMAYAPDGKSLYFSTATGIREWNVATGKLKREIKGAAAPPVYSADGRRFASYNIPAVLLWDVRNDKPVHPDVAEAAHAGRLNYLKVSPDGRFYMTLASDGLLRMWSAKTGHLLYALAVSFTNRHHPVFLPDAKSFLAITSDEAIPVRFDTETGKELCRFTAPAELAKTVFPNDLHLSDNGTTLHSMSEPLSRPGMGYALTWDLATGRVVKQIEVPHDGSEQLADYATFSPNRKWAALNGRLIRVGTNDTEMMMTPDTAQAIRSHFSDDNRLVAVVSRSRDNEKVGEIVVYELLTKSLVARFETGPHNQHSISRDGRFVGVVTDDGASLWDLVSGKRILRWPIPPSRGVISHCCAITPDGRRFLTSHDDGTVLVWDLTSLGRNAGQAVTPLTDPVLTKFWRELASDDTAAAHVAMWELVDRPTQTLVLLKAQVKPVRAADEATVRALVAKLDANEFADREEAQKRLRELGDAALPTLRAVTNLTAEQKPRVQRLLDAATAEVLPAGERLRQVRAVVVLDRLGTADARALLKELAGGVAEARLTREAKAALNE